MHAESEWQADGYGTVGCVGGGSVWLMVDDISTTCVYQTTLQIMLLIEAIRQVYLNVREGVRKSVTVAVLTR